VADTLDQIAERVMRQMGSAYGCTCADLVRLGIPQTCGDCRQRAAILNALQEARADALRDAMEFIQHNPNIGHPELWEWLRARALIAKGVPVTHFLKVEWLASSEYFRPSLWITSRGHGSQIVLWFGWQRPSATVVWWRARATEASK
jgi:hypothetical protein